MSNFVEEGARGIAGSCSSDTDNSANHSEFLNLAPILINTINTLHKKMNVPFNYRVTFLTGPAQKSSKYGTGPTQQQKK